MTYGYPNLHGQWGWSVGVHKAPQGYEHKWLAVGPTETLGAWIREEARELLRALKRRTEESRA